MLEEEIYQTTLIVPDHEETMHVHRQYSDGEQVCCLKIDRDEFNWWMDWFDKAAEHWDET